jgi:hypothetical protein
VELVTIFYCLRFETSLFVASYDSQGHGGGIRPRLHTSLSVSSISHLLNIILYRLKREHFIEQLVLSVVAKTTFLVVAVTEVHCCAKRFTQPLSSDGRYCFIRALYRKRFQYRGNQTSSNSVTTEVCVLIVDVA